MFGLLLFGDVSHFRIVILTIRFIIVLLRICVFQVIYRNTIIFDIIPLESILLLLRIFASKDQTLLQVANLILVSILLLIRIFNVALIDMLLLSLLHTFINLLNLRLRNVLLDFRRFLKILVARNLAILILVQLLLLFYLVVNLHRSEYLYLFSL